MRQFRYGQGIYRIMRDNGGWCVVHLTDSDGRWRRISNLYVYRGWAQAFARRRGLKVQNYEGEYAR